jgi:hypothetical protein
LRTPCIQGTKSKNENVAKIAKANWRIYEVPISYNGRDYSEGKKITWHDGLAALSSLSGTGYLIRAVNAISID